MLRREAGEMAKFALKQEEKCLKKIKVLGGWGVNVSQERLEEDGKRVRG